jgi:NADPH:quinone reductase-like Zn-dependent oxidoreductase
MPDENSALWLAKRRAKLTVGPAPYTPPAADEVVVRVRAVAVNPIDAIPGIAYRFVLPWLSFPAVIGWDVAGEIVEVGENVTRLTPGDRVLGMAAGPERSRNRAAEGAFQIYSVLMAHMVSQIPDDLTFEQAAVLPLALSTAATGLFQPDHLALAPPRLNAPDSGQTVLVWGGSSSVGSNAIQLARCAGYRVITTASPHNVDYVRSLGADASIDYNTRTAVDEVVTAIGDAPLAGILAVTQGSVPPAVAIAKRTTGPRRIAAAQPALMTRIQLLRSRPRGTSVSAIWGATLKDNEVGPATYVDFLPAALAAGIYRAAPEAVLVGDGLNQIPAAIEQLGKGVSAKKLVVRI